MMGSCLRRLLRSELAGLGPLPRGDLSLCIFRLFLPFRLRQIRRYQHQETTATSQEIREPRFPLNNTRFPGKMDNQRF